MEEEEAQLQPQEPQHYTCQRETLLTLAHAFFASANELHFPTSFLVPEDY